MTPPARSAPSRFGSLPAEDSYFVYHLLSGVTPRPEMGLVVTRRMRRMPPHWVQDLRAKLDDEDRTIPDAMREDILRLCGIVETLPGYEYRRKEFSMLADAADESYDLDELSRILNGVGSICGFDHASMFLVRTGEAIKFDTRVCTSLPREWLLHYDRKRYQFLDPVILRALVDDEPFVFSDLKSPAPVIEDFWKDAVKYGIGREGCCFAYTLGSTIRVAMSFVSMGTAEETAMSYEMNRSDLMAFGRAVSEIFVAHAAVMPAVEPRLSIDELRFLKRLITVSDHAGVTELLERDEHASERASICRKLGVATVFQALVVMNRHEWQDDLPFAGAEVAKTYPGLLEHDPAPVAQPIRSTSSLVSGMGIVNLFGAEETLGSDEELRKPGKNLRIQ